MYVCSQGTPGNYFHICFYFYVLEVALASIAKKSSPLRYFFFVKYYFYFYLQLFLIIYSFNKYSNKVNTVFKVFINMSKMRNVPLKKYVIPLFTFHQLFLQIYFKRCGVFIPFIEMKLKKTTY